MAEQRKGVTRNTTPRPALRYGPRPAPADCGLPTSDALRHINESTPFACTNFVYICSAIRNESEAQNNKHHTHHEYQNHNPKRHHAGNDKDPRAKDHERSGQESG